MSPAKPSQVTNPSLMVSQRGGGSQSTMSRSVYNSIRIVNVSVGYPIIIIAWPGMHESLASHYLMAGWPKRSEWFAQKRFSINFSYHNLRLVDASLSFGEFTIFPLLLLSVSLSSLTTEEGEGNKITSSEEGKKKGIEDTEKGATSPLSPPPSPGV